MIRCSRDPISFSKSANKFKISEGPTRVIEPCEFARTKKFRRTIVFKVSQNRCDFDFFLRNLSSERESFQKKILTNLVIYIPMPRHFRFGLVSEKGVVKFLVVDVDFSEFGSDALSHFGLHRLLLLLPAGPRASP